MKDIYVGAPKTARNSLKIVIYESQILRITLYYSELHFSEMTCYKIYTLVNILIFVAGFSQWEPTV